MDVAALIVHFRTPRLTRGALWSLRTCYPQLEICVVNNGDTSEGRSIVESAARDAGNVAVLSPGRNLHHGPGMDFGIKGLRCEHVLLFDSDCVAFRAGFLEPMVEAAGTAYMVGKMIKVDRRGFNVRKDTDAALPYIHPHCAVVNRRSYLELPPFERHGAPCLSNQQAALANGLEISDFDPSPFVLHLGRGTVQDHGYGLGARGLVNRLRHLIRK